MNRDYLGKLFSLDGQKAVVTGGGSGLGRAIAISLAEFGAEVTVTGRTLGKLQETRRLIQARNGVCHARTMDIADADSQASFFRGYLEEQGRLDIFVANAGMNKRAELQDETLEVIREITATDYIGTLDGLIHAAGAMKRQRSGNIVVVTSVNGVSALPNQAVYSSAKAALESAVRSLAASMAPYGVRVNSIAPGCIHSEINRQIFSRDEFRIPKEKQIPLGRIGNPEDIGDVVACMVGDAFRFMTGATLLVDGGELIRPMMNQPIEKRAGDPPTV